MTHLPKILTIFLYLLLATTGLAHDFKMAIYEIYEDGDQYKLNIKFDIDDLQNSIRYEYPIGESGWQSNVEAYIRKHFYLRINEEFAIIRFLEMTVDEDFMTVEATLHEVVSPIKTIDVFSTCLINEVENHTNLIQADFFGKKRYFRLSKDRIKTKIEY